MEESNYEKELAEIDDVLAMFEVYEKQMEEEKLQNWSLSYKNSMFYVFTNCFGETRIISAIYINGLFVSPT